jgi:cytochrome P450
MALTWTLHLLTRNPEVLRRAVLEVDALGGRTPGLGDALPYLDRIVAESLRLYPPAHVFARSANGDDDLDGYRIRGGDWVFISPYLTHRRAEDWPEPLRFEPDRFLPEASAGRHRWAYLPFGGGQRKCIGDTFALLEARLILAVLLQRATFTAIAGYEPQLAPNITLRPANGLSLRVARRTGFA